MLDIISENCFFEFIKNLAEFKVLYIIAAKQLVEVLCSLFCFIINYIKENSIFPSKIDWYSFAR